MHRRRGAVPARVLFLGLIPLAGLRRVHAALRDPTSSGIRLRPDLLALRDPDPRRAHLRRARARPARWARRRARSRWCSRRRASASIAAWPTVAGLVVGTVVFAVGMSLMYPALFVLALDGVSDAERASVVGDDLVVLRRVAGSRRVRLRRGRRGVGQPRRVHRRARSARVARTRACCAPAPRSIRGDAEPAGHERLSAEARRHPVVPLRAVAPAAARRDDRVHDPLRGRGGVGRAAGVPRRAGAPEGAAPDAAR